MLHFSKYIKIDKITLSNIDSPHLFEFMDYRTI